MNSTSTKPWGGTDYDHEAFKYLQISNLVSDEFLRTGQTPFLPMFKNVWDFLRLHWKLNFFFFKEQVTSGLFIGLYSSLLLCLKLLLVCTNTKCSGAKWAGTRPPLLLASPEAKGEPRLWEPSRTGHWFCTGCPSFAMSWHYWWAAGVGDQTLLIPKSTGNKTPQAWSTDLVHRFQCLHWKTKRCWWRFFVWLVMFFVCFFFSSW